MKALHTLKLCSLAVLGLLASACSLFPTTPSLSLDVQSSEYTSTTVKIPYSFQTLTRNSDGTANCSYALSKFDSTTGGYLWIDGNSQTSLQAKGTLSFPLTTILNVTAGSSAVDGLYSLTFSVLSDNYDQSGNPIPFPFLSQTVSFVVHTYSGPEIFGTAPLIVNISSSATPMTFKGTDFTSGGTLNAPSASPSIIASSSYVDPQTITASVNAQSLTAGSYLSLTYTDSSGTTSPTYNIPVVSNVAVSQIVPNGGSIQNSDLPIVVEGSYLGYWSKVTISDAAGHTATMKIQQVAGSLSGTTYLYGHVDLTPLTPTTAGILTVSNPDGTSVSVSFTVTS